MTPASFASVRRGSLLRVASVDPSTFPVSLLPFSLTYFRQVERFRRALFPFLRSDISSSPTNRSPTRRGDRVDCYCLLRSTRSRPRERKRKEERGKSRGNLESERRKLACVLVPSSLIEHPSIGRRRDTRENSGYRV